MRVYKAEVYSSDEGWEHEYFATEREAEIWGQEISSREDYDGSYVTVRVDIPVTKKADLVSWLNMWATD